MYNVDLKNIFSSGGLTCLFAKAILNESNLWHQRLGHINFKTMNKLVKGNLVRGLPSNFFENNHTCVAGKKGKQHRASCKFDEKADEGFLVGYSISSKAFKVFNSRTKIVQETLHINFLENQPNVARSGPTWLFDIDTLTKSMNYQPVLSGNQINPSACIQEHFDAEKAGEGNVQQYVLFPLWSSGSKDPHNADDATNFEVKEHEFEVKEPESTVHVSPSSSAKSKKHDDKTKREAKGKSHVELSTGFRNLSEEFEDFSNNNINEVNADSTLVLAIGQILTNSTNTFSAAALEDITYSDDEEDVGADADFSNLETNITVSPILTTRVHKDHPMTQIIGDLSSAPQTKSMTRMVKEQGRASSIQDAKGLGFEDPDYPDKVYKVVKALYGLHQAPRAWYETLANYLLENGFQRGKIDQTLFIKKQKGDILLVQGLQVKKKQDGIFISHDKYVAKILRKFGLSDGKSASTPIDTDKPLLKDHDSKDVDVHTYRYLKGKPHLGSWYPKDSPFNLVAYSDSDYAGASLDRKSTTRGLSIPSAMDSKSVTGLWVNDVVRLQALIDRRKVIITEDTVCQALHLDDAESIDCLPNEEIFAELARMGLVRNVDSSSKFYMYPRFLQLMISKGFSEVDTPLFEGMLVPQQAADDVANVAADDDDKIAQALEILKLKQRVRRLEKKNKLKVSGGIIAKIDADEDIILEEVNAKKDVEVAEKDAVVQGRLEESQAHVYHIDLEHADKVLITAAATTITVALSAARRRKRVVIRDPEETATSSTIVHSEPKSKYKRKDILVEEPKPLKKQAQIEQDEAYAREPIFEKHFNSVVGFLEKSEKELEEEANKALKRKSKSSEQQAAKKQKLNEEVEELKKHLQIIPNDKDDVYTKATLLALKVPVVDYQIHNENNKPYFKIIRANGTHQLFLSFISLLRNFNREDLEMLWQIVQERFTSLKPKNFLDDFMLTILKAMFEKPDVKAHI
nr:hypothetical protein [Tanacetum cinerariifolium]